MGHKQKGRTRTDSRNKKIQKIIRKMWKGKVNIM